MSPAAVMSSKTAERLVNRSSVGTQGARKLAARANPDTVVAVLDRVGSSPHGSASTATESEIPRSCPKYTTPENLPRPGGRLIKEELDPLVEDASAGNPAAVQALLRMVGPVVVRYCRARLGGRDLAYLSADDVAQEVCMAILKALPGYQDRSGSFLYLVHAIAANKVADAFRAIRLDQAAPVPEVPDQPSSGTNPEANMLNLDLGARLNRLLSTLPYVQQEIIALRIAVGLSAAETAEALGISAGNVRVTQHRALARLRTMVKQDEF